MTINTKISVQQYITIAEYTHAIRHYIETTSHERSSIPRFKWTIDSFADTITFKKYKVWKLRKPEKLYNFSITVDAALAILEGIQIEEKITFYQQDIINLIYQILINKGFSSESLNFQIHQYEELQSSIS